MYEKVIMKKNKVIVFTLTGFKQEKRKWFKNFIECSNVKNKYV